MEAYKVKSLVPVLLILRSFAAQATRQQQILTSKPVPLRAPLLQQRHVAKFVHGNWSHIGKLASSKVSSPNVNIALSTQKQDPCGTQISPLCPDAKQQGPTPDGTIVTGPPTQAPTGYFEIHVKKSFDKAAAYTFQVTPDTTIAAVKAMVISAGDNPRNHQMLLFESSKLKKQFSLFFMGVQLQDGLTLKQYKVSNGDTLIIVEGPADATQGPDESAGTLQKGTVSPATDAPCNPKPPCQQTSFGCHDADPVGRTPHSKGHTWNMHVQSILLLLSVILISSSN